MDSIDSRAAQYVRMSTDMQKYSIQNQADAIALYAMAHGFSIVRSYEDAGRSGLSIESRRALQSLLRDVASGSANFKTVLVYDVSRWGRFQDSDEAAHYEFICKNAGITVVYCAEEFNNDGSLYSNVIKSIKRAMAGEYSRELSKKVFDGQNRLARMGYHIGSEPGYGLRRMLVDMDGNRKGILNPSERKSLSTDRVILVPGPANEIDTIRRVYSLFLDRHETMSDIASTLNREGIFNAYGRDWSNNSIRNLLSNEKYVGNGVYARTSKKLGRNFQKNPSDQWTRSVGAYEAIIPPKRFAQAAKRLRDISTGKRYSDNFLLDALSAFWCIKGRLTNGLLKRSTKIPSETTYKLRFGGVSDAFMKVGYRLTPKTGTNLLQRKNIISRIWEGIVERGGSVEPLPGSCTFLINGEVKAAVVVGRSPQDTTSTVWRFGYRSQQHPDLLIVVRLAHNVRIIDYFVLPFAFFAHGTCVTSSEKNYRGIECYRTDTLEPLFDLCSRQQIVPDP